MTRAGSAAQFALLAAIVAGVSYLWTVAANLDGPWIIAWKGAGVGLLALYAALIAQSRDGWLLAIVMTFGALGDVLLDAIGMTVGALAFILGHIAAIALYMRNRRTALSPSQKLLATLTLPLSVLIAIWSVPYEARPMVGIYAAFVGAMASAAWVSRFPRFRTGIGAMMFLVSDLLIFARMGPIPKDAAWAGLAIWTLYFGGQLLIVLGVSKVLADAGEGAPAPA